MRSAMSAAGSPAPPGVLLLTYRDGEVDADHPLRSVIGDIPVGDVVRIQLGGLSLEGVAELVRPVRLDPVRVLSRTQGNPLLVTEMIATAGSAETTSLADSVLARLQRLTIGAQDALRTLSIIPEPISRDEALGIGGVDDARLDECEARGLLDCSGGRVTFRHALIRETILGYPRRPGSGERGAGCSCVTCRRTRIRVSSWSAPGRRTMPIGWSGPRPCLHGTARLWAVTSRRGMTGGRSDPTSIAWTQRMWGHTWRNGHARSRSPARSRRLFGARDGHASITTTRVTAWESRGS